MVAELVARCNDVHASKLGCGVQMCVICVGCANFDEDVEDAGEDLDSNMGDDDLCSDVDDDYNLYIGIYNYVIGDYQNWAYIIM